MKISDHKIEGAPYVSTTKKGGIITPRLIVMHYTAGWTTEGDVHTLAKSDRPASAHVVLSREGTWTQIVPFNRKAWHAGPSRYPLNRREPAISDNLNDDSIGIEISNIGYVTPLSNGNFKDQYGNQLKPTGQFVGGKRKSHTPPKDWPLFKHEVVGSGTYAWEPYTPAQLDELDDGVAELIRMYPTIKWIVSHEEIDERGFKSDPGPMFPMERYRKQLESRADPLPRYTGEIVVRGPAPMARLQPQIIVNTPPLEEAKKQGDEMRAAMHAEQKPIPPDAKAFMREVHAEQKPAPKKSWWPRYKINVSLNRQD